MTILGQMRNKKCSLFDLTGWLLSAASASLTQPRSPRLDLPCVNPVAFGF